MCRDQLQDSLWQIAGGQVHTCQGQSATEIGPEEIVGSLVIEIELRIDFGHDGHVIAVEAHDRFQSGCRQNLVKRANHLIGIRKVAEVDRQVCAMIGRGRGIESFHVSGSDGFEM